MLGPGQSGSVELQPDREVSSFYQAARLPRAQERTVLEMSLLVGVAGDMQTTEALAYLQMWFCEHLSNHTDTAKWPESKPWG